ncbi:linker histone H1 and H5 family protein [Dictyocaulus viviparus]|uniref:Linker histone H1 and H5 family protein n=1 Tax=Dictyocaulus viviparus TaxID=29172 RepID=A0A0D8XYD9_DICVI|nr:linker histone H1 and H5 family protein [Dictyocaulus viviparus]
MSEVTTAPVQAVSPSAAKKSKTSKPKGEKKPKSRASHPVYGAMIKSAIKELKDRKGASKQAILKFIVQKYKVGDNEKQINAHLRLALKRGVKSGLLKQMTGTGAAGRFRLAEKSEGEEAPKPAKKAKTSAKPKSSGAATVTKKAKKEKSSSSKKSAKPKAKSAKSPKKMPAKKAAVKPKTPKKLKKAAPAKA